MEYKGELKRPIRVVVFSSGPTLERGVLRFLARLQTHPEIELLEVICQSDRQDFAGVIKDLWQRRGPLGLPVLAMGILQRAGRYLRRPQDEIKFRQRFHALQERIEFVSDIHDGAVLRRVRALKPDLGLIYGSPILRPNLFEIPVFGTLGIHHGKVPEYRGKKTTFWAMYNGEEMAGVTIQRVNAGLDTGEIVKQGAVEIGSRSLSTVWDELETLGLDLYIEAILEVKQGLASYLPQVGKKGKLYRDPTLSDILSYWWRQAKRRIGQLREASS